MKAVILYDSMTGNTENIAKQIELSLKNHGLDPILKKVTENTSLEILDYDLVFIGTPVIDWLPTNKIMDFVKKASADHKKSGKIQMSCPIIPGKFAVSFCTFGGPHIGEREAIPATMWLRSFVEHAGFTSLGLWHIPGAFHSFPTKDTLNTKGRMGDISGRPNQSDLKDIEGRVSGLMQSIKNYI